MLEEIQIFKLKEQSAKKYRFSHLRDLMLMDSQVEFNFLLSQFLAFIVSNSRK